MTLTTTVSLKKLKEVDAEGNWERAFEDSLIYDLAAPKEDHIFVGVPIVSDLRKKMKEIPRKRLDMLNWHNSTGIPTHEAPFKGPRCFVDSKQLVKAGNHCRTTHCLAGWATHFAGEAGYELEKDLGPSVAGALIFHAAGMEIPDFYSDDEDAIEWLDSL